MKQQLISNLLSNWNAFRVIRLLLALFILGSGITTGDSLMMVLGGGLIGLTLFNSSCCGVGGTCEVPQKRKQ